MATLSNSARARTAGQVIPSVWRRWRFVGLCETEVVDDELGVGMVACHLAEDG